MKELKDTSCALTKLKSLLKFDTRWEYNIDEPYLVDDVNIEPMYTVNWIGPDNEKHPNTYAVSVKGSIGDIWTWTTRFYSDARSAYEKIEDVMRASKLKVYLKKQKL